MQIHTHRSPYDVRGLTTWEKRLLRLVWIKSALAILADLKLTVQAAQSRRRAAAQLASVDDRMLQDIGISRSEIESAVGGRREMPELVNLPAPVGNSQRSL
jgi:uncharacterized protein YjiS (DUF1127 family)